MKIWIDLTNSPHVNFFAGMINDLKKEHNIILTCRALANTIELLEIYGFPYHVVGKHYGSNQIKKSFGFLFRVWQLFMFLRRKDIDVAISHSSFYSPLVSRFLGVRSIYLNDNEHAAGNWLSFIFADKVMIPEYLNPRKIQKQLAAREKIISYPGLKEGIYLWDYKSNTYNNFKIDKKGNKKVIFIRPEPQMAQYYRGKKNFMDRFLIELKNNFQIVILPRGKVQDEYYKQEKFQGIIVPEKSVSLADVIKNCDLFIGAGGTMTREAAVLGIPTISIYQAKLLDVDKYLIDRGLMIYKKDLDAKFALTFLEKEKKNPPDEQLLVKGKKAYELIKGTLLEKDRSN